MKMLEIPDKEYAAVRRLPGSRRVDYLVKKVCDFETIWGLKEDGRWKLFLEEQGPRFPVWPAKRYAEGAGGGGAVAVGVRRFLDEYVSVLNDDRLMVAVFPVEGTETAIMSPDEFAALLRRELHDSYGE